MRCFIALPLPPEARAALAAWTASFRRGLATGFEELPRGRPPRFSWARPEGYHLTLAFLGEIEGAEIEAAASSLDAAAGSGDIAFGLSAPEGFPARGPWRVVFAALEDGGRCAAAFDAIKARLLGLFRASRLEGELERSLGRPFAPHITIARAPRGLPPPRADAGAAPLASLAGRWTISACALYKSELRRGGSVYTELRSVDLRKGAAP
jgi:RNA 2',3'-cyclic 3'-phosphodiesterase